ncbi:uncharacterized protein LOC133870492 [Alnus glutinosa]|uniref:uncharacterized protein LOC133870492 n=1 Tax=Alnus glutinosa TaxID=3517 RepID=UPI002D798F30|nr:uncharacterized protein LOC133870492 [Alnus glutinosa]
MKRKHLRSGISQISKKGVEEDAATRVTRGDLIWVRLNGGSWWPAQVADENTVNGSIKPRNKSAGEVLVRLYGSYKYLYVDPVKCHSEFELILQQNNGCRRKIFEKALEQDCPRSKYGISKRRGAKSKENVGIDATRDKSNQNQVKDQDIEASNYVRVSPRGHPPTITPKVKVKNGSSRKAEEAKNEASKQDGMKKNLKPNSSSSEERAAENITSKQDRRLQRNLKQCRSSGAEKTSKQNVVQNKLKLDSPSVRPTSRRAKKEARIKISMQGARQSLKRKSPSSDEQLDNKAHELDDMQKKLKPNSSKNFKQVEVQNNLKTEHAGTEKGKKCKIPDQDVQKKSKPNNQSTEEDAKIRTRKEDEVLKKNKLNSPSSETTLFGKSQELSARRTKVMQSLGLIAPSGSPFHKNGNFCLSLC